MPSYDEYMKVKPGMYKNESNITSTSNSFTIPEGYYSEAIELTFSPSKEEQEKTVTPTESIQEVLPDEGKVLNKVSVEAIPSDYVGSNIPQKSASDLTTNGATVTVPSGYYAEEASATVASGTAGTPTATKGTVSNNSISITPSVTNTTGYITGGTKTGTAVTVSASELVSGNKSIDTSTTATTNIDVKNYATVSLTTMPTYTGVSGDYGFDSSGFYQRMPKGYYPARGSKTGFSYNYTPKSVFGDATAADVVSGKKFTSANGFSITGTLDAAENYTY